MLEEVEQSGDWETQSELIDIFRQYIRLDAYGKMNVNALINRETTRCQDQNTEESASGIIIGTKFLKGVDL